MKKTVKFSKDERKTITKILAFYTLEKSIVKYHRLRSLGRAKKIITKKWKKLQPLLDEKHLVLEPGIGPEVSRMINLITLYSKLYTDIIDNYSSEECDKCIQKLKTAMIVPSLNDDFIMELTNIIAVKSIAKIEKKKPVETGEYMEFPHLNSTVRKKLLKQFKKRMREEEPLVMLDRMLQPRVENFVRKHVDRIIDVYLEHAYKAIQYGYISKSSDRLSAYVEKKGMDSIDWTIKSGVLVEELVKSMN